MAFRTGANFDYTWYMKGVGIQHRPATRPLFNHDMNVKPRLIKIDRQYRPVNEVPRWVKTPQAPEPKLIIRKKRAHDAVTADDNVQTRPRKRHSKEKEWAILEWGKPLLCCIEFLLSWTPARLERTQKEWHKKVLIEEMEHLSGLTEQLREHPDFIIVQGQKLNLADAGYTFRSPTSSEPRPPTPPRTIEQGAQKRPPGAPSSGPYRPGAPSPSTYVHDDNTPRPHRPDGAAGKSHLSAPTPTYLGTHKIKLPRGHTHITGPPIRQQPVDMAGYKSRLPLRDDSGRLVNKEGRLVNEEGLCVNEKGQLVDKEGRPIPKLSEDKLPAEPITGSRRPGGQPPPQKPLSRPQLVDERGRFMDERGRLVDEKGRLVNAKGQLIDERGYLVDEYGRIPTYLLPEENPRPMKRPAIPKTRPSNLKAANYQALTVEEVSNLSPTSNVSPPKSQASLRQPLIIEEVPDRSPTPPDAPPPPQSPQYKPQSPQYKPQSPRYEPKSPQFQPQDFEDQPPTPEAVETSEPLTSELPRKVDIPATQPQPDSLRPNTDVFVGNIGEESDNTAAAPTVDPTGFPNDISLPEKALPVKKKPGRMPFESVSDEEEQEEPEPKKYGQKKKPIDNRPPYEKFLANEKNYAPLYPPHTAVRGTRRGRYGPHLAPDMVHGEDLPQPDFDQLLGPPTLADRTKYPQPKRCRIDNPGCQGQGAHHTTFSTGRKLREHEATHNYMMFGAFGPPGSVGADMRPLPISREERERLLREREEKNNPWPVDQTKLGLEQSAREERQRVEREKKARERATDFADEMTQEEFAEQFNGDDAPALYGRFTDEEDLTGEEYQQQLLGETIGDETPDLNGPNTYYDDTVMGEAPERRGMTAEEYQRSLDQHAADFVRRNAEYMQHPDMQRVYTEEEFMAITEEEERRELEGPF